MGTSCPHGTAALSGRGGIQQCDEALSLMFPVPVTTDMLGGTVPYRPDVRTVAFRPVHTHQRRIPHSQAPQQYRVSIVVDIGIATLQDVEPMC